MVIDKMVVIPSLKGVIGPIAHSPTDLRSAMVVGLRNLGIEVSFSEPRRVADQFVACWGWRIGKLLYAYNNRVLVMERGYIGDRFYYTSLGWDGLNGHAKFPEYPDDGGERFRSHGGIIKPWKDGGKYILILGQVAGDQSLQGKNLTPWYMQKAREAQAKWKLPVYFRPHPLAGSKGFSSVPGVPTMPPCSLEDAMSGALFTIAFNSNSCLDSILAGVPCYAGDKGTMAWDLCMKDIGKIVRPDREKTVHKIAWTQWSRDEIESGVAIMPLLEMAIEKA